VTLPAEAHDEVFEEEPAVEYVSLPVSALAAGERRMEAETYLTGGYGLRVQIDSALPFDRLDSIANIWQPSRLKGTLVRPEDGLPFLTATQVFAIRPMPRKYVAPTKTPKLASRFVDPGWILVTCSGSVGDAIISFEPHVGAIVSHDLLRLQVYEKSRRGYVYAFLRSSFGRTILRSSRYGSIIKHLEPEHLYDVPVPQPPDRLYVEIGGLIDHVFRLREEAFRATADAERIYAEQFPAVENDRDETGYSVSSEQMFAGRRRLDGYYYNPRARAVLEALEASNLPIVPLGSVSEDVFGVPRFKHVYRDQGIPYLDSEDLFKINPEITKFIPEVTKKDAARYYVKRGWLLVASSGQLYGFNGSVVVADSWHEGKIVSNHVVRIVPRGIRPGYLAVVLGHPTLGRPLLLRLAFGSEVPEIASEDLRSVPVPRLGAVENEIADRMETASALRVEASREEEAAVGHVERDIVSRLRKEDKDERRDTSQPGRDARLKIHADPEDALAAMLKTPRKRKRRSV
jgi:type I restriction enzyme, S subunit